MKYIIRERYCQYNTVPVMLTYAGKSIKIKIKMHLQITICVTRKPSFINSYKQYIPLKNNKK